MKISLVTVSQWPRRHFLACQVDHVKHMVENFLSTTTESVEMEWILVNASKTDAEEFDTWLKETLVVPGVEVRIITPTKKSRTIGSMRQLANESCRGDIMVCIDDDDYYYPTRISHAVKMLKKSKKDLAACTSTLLLDDDLGVIVRLRGMHDRHGVNSTMAYTRKYGQTHRYDVTKTFAEEPSFTHNFSEPMVQLDGEHVYMQLSHFQNTFSKKKILLTAMNGYAQVGTVLPETPESFLSKRAPKMLDILRSDVGDGVATITFYCGLFSIEWDPECQSLGGSEQAVVHLARCFASDGKSVRVYGLFPFREKRRIEGVDYVHADFFRCRVEYNILILWRMTGMMILNSPLLKARRLVVDLHDHIPQTYQMLYAHRDIIHFVMCKSNFQVHLVKAGLPGPLPFTLQTVVVPNGVRVKLFEEFCGKGVRHHKHLVYASCYTRGLEPLLRNTWPILHRLEPDAVLHVCYGMEHVQPALKEILVPLLKQPGIVHHGRLDVKAVAQLKATCGFHLYYTATVAEIDCISIRESLVVGCIPILSKVNVFGERDGIHVENTGFEVKDYVQLAKIICELFTKDLEQFRDSLKKSPLVMDWQATSQTWWDKLH